MKVNRFYLGILILNILFFKIILDIFISNPEILANRFYLVYLAVLIGTIGIIANTFNAFPKEESKNAK